MKITVTVDLSEFYSEGDEFSFSEQIKEHVVREVKRKILADWKELISATFDARIKQMLESEKDALITSTFNTLANEAKVKKRYSSGEMISISDWLKEEFERTVL